MTKSKTKTITTKKVTTSAFVMLEGATNITSAITAIATQGKRLENSIHSVAVSCLHHADLHGDITLAEKLVHAVPSMARKNALRDWFLAHGKFNYDMKNKTFTYKKGVETLLDAAIATPFWMFKPEADYKPFDLQASVLHLVARAEKAIEKGEDVPFEQLDVLRALVA